MSEPVDNNQHETPVEVRKTMRKPYQKPAVRHEKVFETSALTCGKPPGGGGNCNSVLKTS